jgi:hypothetical protein
MPPVVPLVIATMRNGNNQQLFVAKRQDGDGLLRHTLVTFRERGLSHILKVLLCAAGVELVKRPPQFLRGDRYA